VTETPKHIYEFGPFRLDPLESLLLRDGQPVSLTPKAFDLLVVLVRNSGHLVDKDTLMKEIWPDSFVEEASLTVNMTALRRALGEKPSELQYVETVPRRGYRFVAPVRECGDDATHSATEEPAGEIHVSKGEKDPERWVGSHRSRAIAGSLALLLVLFIGLSLARWRGWFLKKASQPPIESLAVLPLDNLSGDPSQDYFADGVTEELITELSKIGSLRVISRTSVMQFKGLHKPVQEIARDLKVDAIVEGSVIRSGDAVRISVHLIRPTAEQLIWGEAYERDLRDILSLQSDVARSVANQIGVKLMPQEKARLAKVRPVKPEAYEAYLQGLYRWNVAADLTTSQGKKSGDEAIDFFRQAITSDPSYAPAYAWLGQAYYWMHEYQGGPIEDLSKARDAALKALELDDQLAEAHTAVGWVKFQLDWDFNGAEQEFQRAIALDPSSWMSHFSYSWYLENVCRFDEALAEQKRVQELNPLSIAAVWHMAGIYYSMRDYDRSIEQFLTAIRQHPDCPMLYSAIATPYAAKKMYAEALAASKKALEVSKGDPRFEADVLASQALASGKDLDELTLSDKSSSALDRAMAYASLGEKEPALESLEKAYAEHDGGLLGIKCASQFDSLQSEPRFQALLRRINFPQ